MFGAFAFWTSSLIFVGFSNAVLPAFVALIALGMSQNVVGTVTSTLLQLCVPHDQRGRVLSLNTLLIHGRARLGDFPAGLFISMWGPFTAAAGAMIVGLTALFVFIRSLALRSF